MGKEFTIKGFGMYQAFKSTDLSNQLRVLGDESMHVSDGYHTMDELYDHRIVLFITLCRTYLRYRINQMGIHANGEVWRSKLHSDGSSFEGWFILGIKQKKGDQMTYHLPMSYWDRTEFAETLENAPEWDGHTPADVLERLKNL